MCFTPIVIIRVLPIDTAALSRENIKKQAAPMALPAFSFLFRNGKQSKAQRAAALPLPFGLLFRPHTGAAGEFLSTEAPTSSALDGGGLDGTMKAEAEASPAGQRTPFDYLQDGKGWEEEAASFSDEIVKVELPRGKYPEAEKHMEDAIKNGHPSVLTIQRGGARTNRKKSLRNIDKIPGMDLDEYPPAMFSEGGAGASVRLINRHDNRGAGSAIGNQLRRYPNGTKVKITFID